MHSWGRSRCERLVSTQVVLRLLNVLLETKLHVHETRAQVIELGRHGFSDYSLFVPIHEKSLHHRVHPVGQVGVSVVHEQPDLLQRTRVRGSRFLRFTDSILQLGHPGK